MKILIFLPELGLGGAQRTLVNLANKFSKTHEVLLVSARAQGPALAWLDQSKLLLVDLGCRRTATAVLPLARQIAKTKPDIVFASMVDANIVAWIAHTASRSGASLVLRETNSHDARADLSVLRKWLIGAAYRNADRVVALSAGVRGELQSLYRIPDRQIVTIHNPVEVFNLRAAVDSARQEASPWRKRGPAIIGIGRLTRQKGFDTLIRIVSTMNRKDVDLVLLGEGDERKVLMRIAQERGLSGRLLMPGYVPDPARWLAHADVFALSSRWEGFGHVIVEAMAARLPVVAFDCPYGPRDIIRDGVNGYLVAQGDETAFSKLLSVILERDNKTIVEQAFRDAEKFEASSIAEQYISMFKSIRTS